jgi:Tfp pilus assembly protein FimT
MRSANRAAAYRSPSSAASAQRGVTLFGLLFWAVVVSTIGYLAMRVFPTVNEYLTIKKTIEKVAASSPATVAEARAAFDRQKDVEYSISSISGKDLEITKEDERVVISFAYNNEVPLYGPVFLLIKYEGRSSSK